MIGGNLSYTTIKTAPANVSTDLQIDVVVVENVEGGQKIIDGIKLLNYLDLVNAGYIPMLFRKISYTNKGTKRRNNHNYGWRRKGIDIVINKDGFICDEHGNVLKAEELVMISESNSEEGTYSLSNGKHSYKFEYKNISKRLCRYINFGIAFVNIKNKNISAYRIREKDFASNIVPFKIKVTGTKTDTANVIDFTSKYSI